MSALLAYPTDYGHMDGAGGWMWLWGSLMMVFWVAVIGGVIWLLVRNLGGGGSGTSAAHRRAREVLAERYARGEMTTEEYRERLDALR